MSESSYTPASETAVLEPTMTKLLPCPFCGGRADIVQGGINGRLRTYGLVDHAVDCWFPFGLVGTHYQHIPTDEFAAWNRRAE